MRTECEQIQERFGEYAENSLPLLARARVEGHVAGCRNCAALLKVTASLVDALGEIPEASLPRGFEQRLHARLLLEAESPVAAQNRQRSLRRRRFAALSSRLVPDFLPGRRALAGGGLAAAAVVVTALTFTLHPALQSPQPSGEIATPGVSVQYASLPSAARAVPAATTEPVSAPAPAPVSANAPVGARAIPVAVPAVSRPSATPHVERVAVGKEAVVRIWFEADRSLDAVRFTLTLPEGLRAVSGGRVLESGVLTWEGKLEQGVNLVPLRVRGVAEGEWKVNAAIERGGTRHEQSIGLHVDGV
ncbi:MAG: zf-HC2 domain-containing protein [Nitrospirota bacterium]|nr:zf-HC2 domain-containing protein [Nitrospirota bacterium]